MKYGREAELESDDWGVRLCYQAGYDPRAMIGVMKVLEEATGGQGPPEFFSTHPKPANRVEFIEKAIAKYFPNGIPAACVSSMELPLGFTIMSGGQTGADRAALDFAIRLGIPHEGWCPRGRRAEDGPLDACYKLRETPSLKYDQRTRWNVRDSDATLVVTIRPKPTGGTALTLGVARQQRKPCLHIARDETLVDCGSRRTLGEFLAEHQVERLNVAGPRASQEPEIAAFVRNYSLSLVSQALMAREE